MKAFLILLFPWSAFCQEVYTFPADLLADPYQFEIKQLGIRRIEQSHTTYWNSNNGFTKIDSTSHFDYIIDLDSSGKVSSFKYDFELEFQPITRFSPLKQSIDGSVTIYIHNDSSRLQQVIYNTDTVFYNYYENVFKYNQLNEIESINVIRPYRSIIDGVYLVEHEKNTSRIEEKYAEGLLIQRTYFVNNELVNTETFEYKMFSIGDRGFRLLHRLTRNNSRHITVYSINYIQ